MLLKPSQDDGKHPNDSIVYVYLLMHWGHQSVWLPHTVTLEQNKNPRPLTSVMVMQCCALTASMRESLGQLMSLYNFFHSGPSSGSITTRWSAWWISRFMAVRDFLPSIRPPPLLTHLPSSPGQSSAGQTHRMTNCTVSKNQVACKTTHKRKKRRHLYLQFLQHLIHEVAGVLLVVQGSVDHLSEHLRRSFTQLPSAHRNWRRQLKQMQPTDDHTDMIH